MRGHNDGCHRDQGVLLLVIERSAKTVFIACLLCCKEAVSYIAMR